MSRSRKRKKAPRTIKLSLLCTALVALVLLAYLIIMHFWLLAALVGICALLAAGAAMLFSRRRAQQHLMWRERLRTLDDLIQLTPTQFELITVELLRTQGFRHVRHTGGGGDLAADIICYT